MIPTLALLAVAGIGSADVRAVSLFDGLPSLAQPTVAQGTRLALRSPLLEAPEHRAPRHDAVLAQQRLPAQPISAPADSPAPAAEEEPSIDLIRHRAAIMRTHRPLGITTVAAVGVTEVLGTLLAINRATIFGNGECNNATGCILGDFGGSGLDSLHEISAFISVSLYATTGIFALSMPDPEHAMSGNDTRGSRLRLHRALAYAHLIGMVAEPILGILAYDPTLFGITDNPHQDFARDLRTIHLGVGYATFAVLTTAMIVELLN